MNHERSRDDSLMSGSEPRITRMTRTRRIRSGVSSVVSVLSVAQVIGVWLLLAITALAAQTDRWSEKKARDWYAKQPWLIGSNYNPATAINQLEMWQADSFDPKRIDLELGWAEGLGMNPMRAFLHDLLWQQ